ncbi:MAG: tetratricopeptide repeat protein [Pseudomonadota bacterium]
MTINRDEPSVLLAAGPSGAVYAQRLWQELSFRGYLVNKIASEPSLRDAEIDGSVRAVLVIATDDADDGGTLRAAVAWARANERPVLPLLLSGEPWAQLADLNFTDVRGEALPSGAFFQRIDDSVQEAETSLSEGAWALLQQGMWQAALRGFAQRVAASRDDSNALIGRGFSALGLGRYEQALGSFERALAREPASMVALAGRGEALVGLGDLEPARAALSRVLERAPDAKRSALPLSQALAGLGQPETALEILQRAFPESAIDEPFVSAMASRLAKLNASSDAFHEEMPIERFLALLPSNSEVERCRAMLLERMGKRQQARRARRRAVSIALADGPPTSAIGPDRESGVPTGAAVFISYSRDDREYVRQLVDWLTQAQVPVWFDDAIRTGDQWMRDIEDRLRAAAAVVVVVSPSALDSTWVRRELLLADRLQIPILPLLLAGEPISLLLDLQHVDVSGERLPQADWLVQLRGLIGARPQVTTSPADAHFQAGEALLKLLRVRDALREFNRGIAADPQHADCYVGRGSALTQVGALAARDSEQEHPMLPWINRALEAYEQAIALEPTNGNGHLGRAVMLMNLDRADESREAVRTAVRVDPANADVRSTWGAYLVQEGRFEEAIEHFEAALRLNPRHSQAFQNRAYALHQLGREDEDEEAFWIAAGYMEKPQLYEVKRAARGLGRRLKRMLSRHA